MTKQTNQILRNETIYEEPISIISLLLTKGKQLYYYFSNADDFLVRRKAYKLCLDVEKE